MLSGQVFVHQKPQRCENSDSRQEGPKYSTWIAKTIPELKGNEVLKTSEEMIRCRRPKDKTAMLQLKKLFTKAELKVQRLFRPKLDFYISRAT